MAIADFGTFMGGPSVPVLAAMVLRWISDRSHGT
jgi:hypothetical protein